MPQSHHSHSGQFCRHAKGTLEQVVQEAIKQGFTTFGLSEHAPRYRQQDLYPEESDLSPTALHEIYLSFLDEAHRLRAIYSSEITLLIGIETDLITPLDLTGLSALLEAQASRIDYVVGSLHHVHQIPIDFDEPTFLHAVRSCVPSGSDPDTVTEDERIVDLIEAYLDGQFELMRTIRPEVIGHFDLIKLWNPSWSLRTLGKGSIWSKVKRNVKEAVDYGALFELNAAAFRKGWNEAYPSWEILELVVSAKGRLCLSDDSHGPQAVGLNYHKLHDYLRAHDISELWYLSLDDLDSSSSSSVESEDDNTSTTHVRKGKRSGRVRPKKVEGDWWEDRFWKTCLETNKASRV
ncbi:EB [Phaffia rhodozyma]|uniref:Histidinol-phosphatase n=1 Tax=Phaffia rhodozyma TaxID=264483 RepID=A0A0F7SQB2_PHARH|nr:EB [Phaffia rhodozyma]